VSIFIDHCPAAAIQRKVEKKGERHWIDNENEVNSCIAWGYQDSHGLRGQRSAY